MLRVLVVLMLALGVGAGYVGRDVGCSGDDCGLGTATSDHGGDDCPPLCGGCARLAADTAPVLTLADVPRVADAVVAISPAAPRTSPPRSGLFRPPRA